MKSLGLILFLISSSAWATSECSFRQITSTLKNGERIPTETVLTSDSFLISNEEFSVDTPVVLRDSTGTEVDKITINTGTKFYPQEGETLLQAHVRYNVPGLSEEQYLGLILAPDSRKVRSIGQVTAQKEPDYIEIIAYLQCEIR